MCPATGFRRIKGPVFRQEVEFCVWFEADLKEDGHQVLKVQLENINIVYIYINNIRQDRTRSM